MAKFITFLLVSVSGGAATQMYKFLASMKLGEGISEALAALVGATLFTVLEVVFLKIPYKVRPLRLHLDRKYQIEGQWVETITKQGATFYSLFSIDYDHASETFTVSGVACEPNGRIHATWKSLFVHVDVANNRIIFCYSAHMVDDTSESIEGFTVNDFEKDSRGYYTRGFGRFVDSGTRLIQCHFTFDRLSPEDIESLLGKKTVTTTEDRQRLLMAYHKKHSSSRCSKRPRKERKPQSTGKKEQK